jgi:hypothetical protein
MEKRKKTTFLIYTYFVTIFGNKNILLMLFRDTDFKFGNAWKTKKTQILLYYT